MLKIIGSILSISIIIALTSCQTGVGGDEVVLASKQDSISYAHGINYQIGDNGLGKMGVNLNPDKYLEGFNAAKSDDPNWSMENATLVLMSFTEELRSRQGAPFTEADPVKTNMDSLSLALGAYDANTYKGCGFEAQGEAICAGIREAQANSTRLSAEVYSSLNQTFDKELNMAMLANREEKGKESRAIGEQFLAENKDKEGVQVTASGLQYKVLKQGSGASPTATQTVKVHYEGRLIDGKVFDSSIQRGEPMEFEANRVIPGWTEGLQLMKVGSKYQFYIPTDLAYGIQGAGADIGPYEALIFDVELLEIK